MRRVLLIMMLVACATASAEVFRHIGPDGEVYFSDTASAGAERVELRTPQTVTLPEARRREVTGNVEDKPEVNAYAQFEIVKPSYNQGVRANDGSVTVYMSLQPALRPGHTIELVVDGEDGASIHAGESLNFNLHNLSRGRHSVAARVKNARGETLIETGPVGFYVLRVALGR